MAVEVKVKDGRAEISIVPGNGDPGPAGPNVVTTATATDIAGVLKGDGSHVGQATPGVDFAAGVHVHSESDVTGLTGDLANKVDKATGKGLSTNDYTTVEKNKLASIDASITKEYINEMAAAMSIVFGGF